MNIAWSLALVTAMAGAAWGNDEDDDDKATAPRLTYEESEAQIRALEARLASLEQQDSEEIKRLKAAAAKEAQEEQKDLPRRVSELEKKIATSGQTWDASKMLSFSTADGDFTAKVGGRIYLNYRHIFDRNDGAPPAGVAAQAPDTLFLDTARIQLDGTFYKDFFYRIESEAQSQAQTGFFKMKEVYLGWNAVPDYLSLWAGQMKTPWSQEETCSSRFIDFGERSILNRLSPTHDVGFLLKGALADKIVEWNLGGFNGTLIRDGGRNTVSPDDEFDVVGRLFLTPLKNSDVRLFKQTRIGFDFTRGDRDDVALPAAITTGDLGGLAVNPFAPPAGVTADGIHQRMLLNFSWIYGPASLRAEYAIIEAELNDVPAALASDFEIKAWYLSGSFILTGEDKPLENRIKPNRNLNLSEGGWGAFELAARIAFLDTSDGEDAGVVAATANQETRELTVGLNWWWSPNVALRLNFERFTFDEDLPIATGNDPLEDHQDVFYVRWQIDF